MYFPVGWPRVLKLPPCDGVTCQAELRQVVCNRDKILTAIITSNALQIWYVKPCVPIISHRRPAESIEELGENVLAQWRPDSSMICVVTSKGHLIIYHIVVPTDIKTLYEQVDTPASSMKRESDELFLKELIPPLIFSLAFEVDIEGGVSDLVAIREELMIATTDGRILRFSWDGQEIRDYSLDLRRIPFCVDQQVLKAVPLADKGAFVTKISYSPLLGGYAIVLNDGRAAFLVASSNNFDPNSVTGIWTPGVDDATCVALNHKYKLMAFGRKNSQGAVFGIDEMSGGLALSHKLVLKTRDYPGNPGEVTCLKWTPDGTALAMTWSLGGFSLWSTFGSMIMCSLCWDYGIHVSDPVSQNPVCITSLDWSAEGYQMWLVNASKRPERPQDPEFMPFPTTSEDQGDPHDEYKAEKERQRAKANPLANKALIFQFVKSPISVNPGMTKQEHIYLQGEDRLYLNLGQTREFNDKPPSDEPDIANTSLNESKGNISLSMMSSGSKLWTTISIPHTYMGSSWPIRFTSLDAECQYLAVAGRTGLAHYSVLQRKWRLFGNETQEKDFIVTGGLLWWKDFIIVGCYNLAALHDEVRIYPRNEKLDNVNAKMWKVETQVLLLNLLNDLLVVFCADNQIRVYNLTGGEDGKASSLSIERVRTFDVSNIPGLAFHPACVILVALTNLRTETQLRSAGNRDSLSRDSPTNDLAKSSEANAATPSIILNICGRVVMIQTEAAATGGDQAAEQAQQMMMPTVLASCCETIWFPRDMDPDKPHLTASLWLYCGAHGMKVWLPVFPREGDHGHTFMSKRIMLHFPIERLYPLAILFEDAIILGAENDTMLMSSKSTADHMSATAVPFSTLERNSLLFLHPILRQLIRRNLGYHAWEIARTCMMLPYFQHSLELLLHEVLEEEATSTEPIPDALLPSVVEFIQEFSVFHRTIGRCARKTEVALWPHLFAVVGSPRTLFMECLSMKDLETASSYLLILQNLEPPAVAQNHATLLLDAALDTSYWELAKDLVRFLRTIDPEELECMSPRQLMHSGSHYGKANHPNLQSPPIKPSAPEEEISLLLGTLQVPRGRSASYQGGGLLKGQVGQLQQGHHRDLNRSKSTVDHVAAARHKDSTGSAASGNRSRKTSASDGQTTDEFFIDVILQRHARKLLSQVRLFDLGTFAAQLDFHMVTWLKRESLRAARVDNFVPALKKVHTDFSWPFPILLNSVVDDLKRKQSAESGTGSINSPFGSNGNDTGALDERLRLMKLESERSSHQQHHRRQSSSLASAGEKGISDSGYVSHSTTTTNDNFNGSDQNNVLSEQIIHAMLKPRPQSYREDSSIISDDGGNSITSPDELLNGNGAGEGSSWPSSPAMQQQHLEYVQQQQQQQTQQDVVSKGPQKSEIQLRYLLQLMLEANCLELASIVSVVLKDALALIRIVNAARTSSDAKVTVSRLYHSLKSLEAWAQASCHGYMPFFRAIQPQLNSLKSFLNFQTPPVSPQHSKMEFRRATLPPGGAIGAGAADDSRKSNGGHPGLNQSVFHRASTQNLLHRARKKTQQMVISKRRSLPSNMTGTAVMSPVVREEQREMARRNTVNEDREDEELYSGDNGVNGGDAIVVDDEHIGGNVQVGVDHQLPTLVRSASVPLDPKADEEYDTRSVTSDILPEGQDEQPGCVIA